MELEETLHLIKRLSEMIMDIENIETVYPEIYEGMSDINSGSIKCLNGMNDSVRAKFDGIIEEIEDEKEKLKDSPINSIEI